MGLLVLLLFLAGVVCLAYGLSQIYAPLAPITGGVALLLSATLLSNTLPKAPRQ